ncbi:GTP 3',8-cyclase MoaA [Paenibacillus sp. 481]|nr:GTP 3',8-cyclase MoaA [Paenibacillus sp. 481]
MDAFGRPLRDLRISVTDRCNFRCTYCMPEEIFGEHYSFLPREQLLRDDEIVRLVSVFTSLGVNKVRITGGEPLLRKDLPHLLHLIKSAHPKLDLALTSNGVLLSKQAVQLKAAGLERVNVSLDTLKDDVFQRFNSRKHEVAQVLAGIQAAAAAGLQVKVNMVVIKGVNDDEVVSVARYFRGTGCIVRFIEYMDVGNRNGWQPNQVMTQHEIVEQINAVMPVEAIDANYEGEVATRFRYKDTNEEFGVISSIANPFCGSCSRARLSSDGKLYTCLFATKGYELRDVIRSGVHDAELISYVTAIWNNRADRYSEERFEQKRASSSDPNADRKIEMSYIGG